ncbi:Maltose/maltodextrin import ATP-binding protein MalK [compost metagenome]
MSCVLLNNIKKTYPNGNAVIHGVDLEIKQGEFVVFVGPSGCGKSTLLRMIAGLEAISEGDLHIGNKRANDLDPARRGVAMVFQSYALYPHLTVAENMGFSLLFNGTPKDEITTKVNRVAETLQLAHLLDRKPAELSGGQRQRVAIGRAIVREPDVFLFDEPLSNLDAALRGQMRTELARLHQKLGTTMIYVTHDQVEAMTLGDRIVVFNKGHIEQVGSPLELYQRPATEFVATFLGMPKMNLLTCKLTGAEGKHWQLTPGRGIALAVPESSFDCPDQHSIKLGIRPEHLLVGAEGASGAHLQGRVSLVENLGDSAILHIKCEGLERLLLAKVNTDRRVPACDEAVSLTVALEYIHLFGEQGQSLRR